MESLVYVALGSNLGHREHMIGEAVERMRGLATGKVRASSLYATEPEGMGAAPEFINAVAEFTTNLAPEELLAGLQAIEIALGRPTGHQANESRTIDLDLIAFGDSCIDTQDFKVPHPRAHLRDFVMVPLAELAPELVLPGQTRNAAAIAGGLSGAGRIISKLSKHQT